MRLVLHVLAAACDLYLVVSALIGAVNVLQLIVGLIVVLTNLGLGSGAARRRGRDNAQ